MDKKNWNSFKNACNTLGVNPYVVLNFLSSPITLESALRPAGFFAKNPLENSSQDIDASEILYKDGDRITGNEEVIRTRMRGGVIRHFISEDAFWVSIEEDFVLKKFNLKTVHSFSPESSIHPVILNAWPRVRTVPKRIYFVRKSKAIMFASFEQINKKVIKSAALNLIVAFNIKYPLFHKSFPQIILHPRGNISNRLACFIYENLDLQSYIKIEEGERKQKGFWFAGVI